MPFFNQGDIIEVNFDPTPRPQEELCLFFRRGACGACGKRCVADALSIEGGVASPALRSSARPAATSSWRSRNLSLERSVRFCGYQRFVADSCDR